MSQDTIIFFLAAVIAVLSFMVLYQRFVFRKGIQKKMWKKKKYPSTSSNKKKDAISLQSRTASPGEGAGQRT